MNKFINIIYLYLRSKKYLKKLEMINNKINLFYDKIY